jgi:SAM-dependent methyltransferase
MQDYLQKASLSPWVPLSDAAARKIFDLAQVQASDIHVDLGSGDGRVCFHAIDFGVQQSTGIDVDEGIVQVARDRLGKRHPPPPLEFIVADLLDPDNEKAWNVIQNATLITMYFAKEALHVFRPLLEQKLVGRKCKIITCGYEMPNWAWTQFEVVLGTQLYLYDWGSPVEDDSGDLPFIDSILANRPTELEKEAMDSERFQGANVIDRTNAIRGFDPRILEEMDEDEDWDEDLAIEEEAATEPTGDNGESKSHLV